MVSTHLKNMSQTGFIFPNFRGENVKKSLSCHHLFFECLSWSLSHPSSCFPFRQHVAFGNEKKQHQGSHSKHVLPHVRLPQVHGLISKKPSRELTYPTLGKENHLQNAIFGRYVSSLEGNHLRSIKPYPANHRTYFCMKSWCLKTLVYQPI